MNLIMKIPKEVEAKGPSEYERSDEEDTSTPLEKKSKKPRTTDQILMDKAMARVEARRKELADVRATKAAKTAKPATMEEAKKQRLEKAKALQEERKRLKAEEEAQEEAEAAQAAQTQEKEVIDLTGTIEYLKKIEKEKHLVEQRAAQFAREKIKEALNRKAEEPILEPSQGSPKRYATLVRLHFQKGKLKVSHAQLESQAYSSAKQLGKPRFREFAEAPKTENLLSYFGDLAGMAFGTTLTDNANTGVVKLGDGRVVCFTETIKGSIQINPDTLETLGRFEYEDKIGGLIHSPHPFVNDKELITLIPDLLNPGYTIVRMEVGTNTRKVIGRVKCRGKSVGWVHSFPVTENYIVVPEISLKYSVVNLLKSDPCPYYKFDWEPHYEAFVHIIDRKTGEEVTNVKVPPFVTFHFINAYEDVDEATGKVRVIADCCEHMNRPTILACMHLDALRENPKDTIPDARVGRLIVPLDGSLTGELVTAVPQEGHGRGLDMCTINPLYMTQKHRYVYACGAHRPAHFPNMLTKVDMVNKTTVNWYEDGGIPSEPFFVSRPGARAEDDDLVLFASSIDWPILAAFSSIPPPSPAPPHPPPHLGSADYRYQKT
ncbi:hypothetical protein L7F22_015862 [Adiantum nelumboides]|nr:hypothetical protein [Adiantum nelumboides]